MRKPAFVVWSSLLVVGACLLNVGCTLDECGDAVYPLPDDPQPGVRSARHTESSWFGLLQSITYYSFDPVVMPEPDFEVRDLKAGDGALATSYRRLTLEVTAQASRGKRRGPEKLSFIYPSPSSTNIGRFGAVPERFLAGVAGMRVGGEREFTLTPEMEEIGRGSRPSSELSFLDESDGQVLALPAAQTWQFEVRLVAICKPTMCNTTTYSVPAMTNKGLMVLSCD